MVGRHGFAGETAKVVLTCLMDLPLSIRGVPDPYSRCFASGIAPGSVEGFPPAVLLELGLTRKPLCTGLRVNDQCTRRGRQVHKLGSVGVSECDRRPRPMQMRH